MKRWEMQGYNSAVDLGSSGQVVARGRFNNLSPAKENAQQWVVGCIGRSAKIINRITGKLKIRYWFDGKLQHMDY